MNCAVCNTTLHGVMSICMQMQICNEGLKLMLKDSSTRELEEYKDKVSAVGAAFSEDKDMQGATFAYVLYKMTEHVQVDQIHNLQVSRTPTLMSVCLTILYYDLSARKPAQTCACTRGSRQESQGLYQSAFSAAFVYKA